MEIEYNKPYKYKEMCELMGDEIKNGGKNRKLQFEKWLKKYDIEKIKTKYVIKREKDKKEIEKALIEKDIYKDMFKVSPFDSHKAGIYMIKNENDVYIGQTGDFRKRFFHHIETKKNRSNYTKELLENGGTFTIIELVDDLDERLKLEKYYIKLYKELNYNVVNKQMYERTNSKKTKYKTVKVKLEDYNQLICILSENNIEWK